MGMLRLLLALTVLNWHYAVTSFNFIFSYSAVFIFFIISGFYMAMVITEKYGNDAAGIWRFYKNRAIRIYPAYFVVLIACHVAGQYDLFAEGPWAVVNYATIFSRALWSQITFNVETPNALALGQMYSVALEIIFYAMAPFIVLRSFPLIVGLFVVGAAVNGIIWYLGVSTRQLQTEFFPAVFMYFLAGVLAYRFYVIVRTWSYPPALGYAALPALVLCGWATPSGSQVIWTNNASVFAYYALCAALVPFLFLASKDSKFDRFIGDLSYPLYVAHVPAIWVVWATPWLKSVPYAPAAVLALSMLFALMLALLLDRPLEKLRQTIAISPIQRTRLASI